jgi:hypothetical protein
MTEKDRWQVKVSHFGLNFKPFSRMDRAKLSSQNTILDVKYTFAKVSFPFISLKIVVIVDFKSTWWKNCV